MSSLVVVDVMTPAVALSKAGQAAVYTVFQDQRAVDRYLTSLRHITEGTFSGELEKEGPGVAAGTFRGAEVGLPERYQLRRTDGDDSGQTNTGASSKTDLTDAIQRRRDLAASILETSAQYLDSTAAEKMICHVFDMDRIMTAGDSDYGEAEFLDLVGELTTGNVTLPATPCSDSCLGSKCRCLIEQYRIFKQRVVQRSTDKELQSVWLPADSSCAVRVWRPENVLRSLQDVRLGLHRDIPDLVELAEICLLMSRSQSDTERVGKTAKQSV